MSRRHRAHVVLMSQKLVDKLAPGGANFYTARSDEKWRHIHDVCTSLCDTSTTSARHAYEMKTRTRILNRLKFSPLLAEYLRHPETSLRHVKTFVRVPHDTWRVIASYNSQQLVAQTRDSVTGALWSYRNFLLQIDQKVHQVPQDLPHAFWFGDVRRHDSIHRKK